MMHIVVAMDGSQPARLALDWAQAIAPAPDQVTLHLVHGYSPVYPIGDMGASGYVVDIARGEADGRDLLTNALASVTEHRAVTHLVKEPPAMAVLRVAEQCPADLIAVGRRGGNPITNLLLGSVSADIVHRSRAPVLVVHDTRVQPVRRLLVGVDGSAHSARALAFAVDWFPDAKITALHVAPTAAEKDSAGEVIAQTIDRAGVLADRVTPLAAVGGAADGLVSAYRTGEYEMAVVGSRGMGAFGELFLGSVSERLLRLGPGPVIVVK